MIKETINGHKTRNFNYKGANFIIDKLSFGYLVTESNFKVKGSGSNEEDAVRQAKMNYDSFLKEY